jgi:hypothetical protein
MVFVWVIVGLLVAGGVYYYGFTEKGRAEAAATQQRQKAKRNQQVSRDMRKKPGGSVRAPISAVGVQNPTGGGLACPKCGGTQFKARRSKGARVGIAATTIATGGLAGLGAAAVTKQRKVQCVTCGTIYERG